MSKLNEVIKLLDGLNLKDIKTYDFNKTSPFYDYFIIATASDRQANAAAQILSKEFKQEIKGIEGKSSGWVLVDLNDIVVHLFQNDQREFYGLDKMLFGLLKK